MIALFAAVSFSMSQSLRGSGTAITKDKAKIAAVEIVDYLREVRNAVKLLKINGCSVLDINFSNTINKKGNNNPIDPAPAGATSQCAVFTAAGAGVKPRNFEEYVSPLAPTPGPTQWYPAHLGTRYVDASQGTSENDLAHYTTAIDIEVCKAALSLLSSGRASDISSVAYTTGGVNSFTPGAAGSLTAITPIYDGLMYVVKLNGADNYCHIGAIVDVQ